MYEIPPQFDNNLEQWVNDRCWCNFKGYQFRQLTFAFNGNTAFQLYNLGSAFGSCWLAYVIYTYREFACHPMKLFMIIAIADASTCFNQFFAPYACILGIPKLMCWTLLGRNATPANQILALNVIQNILTFNESLFLYLSLTATMMLCVDLILMIKHPFRQKEPRMKFYVWFSVLTSLGVAILFQ